MKVSRFTLLALSFISITTFAKTDTSEYAEGCMFDKRIDCREGADECIPFGSEGQGDLTGMKNSEIRRAWVYTNAETKQREIMLCGDEGQNRCIKTWFTQRKTKDGGYVGSAILQNPGTIPELPKKLPLTFSSPGGALQTPFQLIIYKDTKDGPGWSLLYMGKCDFAKLKDVPVGKAKIAGE